MLIDHFPLLLRGYIESSTENELPPDSWIVRQKYSKCLKTVKFSHNKQGGKEKKKSRGATNTGD